MSVDPHKIVPFDKSIILSNNEGNEQKQFGTQGQLRFNLLTLKFEGYHSNAGALLGDVWRPLTQDFASSSNLGVIKVGSNLNINPTTGVLSSIAAGISRYNQLIITVSPILGAADYQTINEAISNAIGTPAGGYMDGSLTSILGSPPSTIYPFIIQIAPGQYLEPSNQIVLPDYVSLLGEPNYNTVITINSDNYDIGVGSLIIAGHNAAIQNLVINLDGINTSQNQYINGIYIDGKNNVFIDNVIFKCGESIQSQININCFIISIFLYGGTNNIISNCQFLYNININAYSNVINGCLILNSIVQMNNNIMNFNITVNNDYNYVEGIIISDINSLNSISDICDINNLKVSINIIKNTTINNVVICIAIENSSVNIRNSQLECANNPALGGINYGIAFQGNDISNLSSNTSSNILSFTNRGQTYSQQQLQQSEQLYNDPTLRYDTINSADISLVNFTTLGFMRGQYIKITNSQYNDNIYKIADVPTSNTIAIESNYSLINEPISLNTITINSLYNLNVKDTTINASTNGIADNSFYIASPFYYINLENITNIGNDNMILSNNLALPTNNSNISTVIYNTYKTITVGTANCDYKLVSTALTNISGNNANSRYKIVIAPGIYTEYTALTCLQYVDIEGSGENTILQFYRALSDTTPTTFNSNATCIMLNSYSKISNLKVINSSADNTNSLSILLCNSIANNQTIETCEYIEHIELENLVLESVCGSVYNYGILLSNASNITLNNVSILTYSNANTSASTYISPLLNTGILFAQNDNTIDINNITCNNINITVNSPQCDNNMGISFYNTNAILNNINISVNSAISQNIGIKSENTRHFYFNTENLIQIYNGSIYAQNALEYSVYADDYYTIVCNGVNIIGDTFTSPISSRILCNGCYTFTSSDYNTSYQSLSSRGQNEQVLGTITIGDSAGKLNSIGIDNTFIGVSCGNNISSGSFNTALGNNAGSHLTLANNNTLIGFNTGNILNDINNTFIGSNAGANCVSGSDNIFIGNNAGNSSNGTNGSNGSDIIWSTIIGSSAGMNLSNSSFANTLLGFAAFNSFSGISVGNTVLGAGAGSFSYNGDTNTFIGLQSGLFSNGNNNVFIGYDSGFNNQSDNITAIGTAAGAGNTTGVNNTFLGYQTGSNNTIGDANTFIGNNAGFGSSISYITGSYNTVIGNESGYSLSTGARNILIGSTSSTSGLSHDAPGWALSSGNDNIILGVQAGYNTTSATNNIILGTNTGSNITTACNNVLIGKDTATALNTIGQSVIIGANAGQDNTLGNALLIGYNAGIHNTADHAFALGYGAGDNVSGDFNMFMGYNACGLPSQDTTGSYNIAIGPYTGFFLTTGSRNVILGSGDASGSAGRVIQSGCDNTLIGYKAGGAIITGSNNTLVGSNAGAHLTSGAYNLILGYQSGYTLNNGHYNVIVGPFAGYTLNNGSYNIYSGYKSGYNNISGNYNINLGYNSGYTSTYNDNNIHIGYNAGYKSIADDNIFIGTSVGVNNTTGKNNIFIGQNAGNGNNPNNEQIGDNNIFLGTNAGNANDNGLMNIFMGYKSGSASTSGSKNIFIGENTGSLGNTSHNIFIGSSNDDTKGIGYNANGTGEFNVFIGCDVGIENTVGLNNIFIGNSAGVANTIGYDNIYLGTNAGHDGNGLLSNYNIAIGSSAGQNNQSGTQNILIGTQVASGNTSTDYNNNIILGSDAGQNIQQDDQIFIGTNAGKNNTTGANNIFIGLDAGMANTTSVNNTILGSSAGSSMIGFNNTIVGAQAAKVLLSGVNNIYIGANAGYSAITSNNNVVIGAYAMLQGDSNNSIIIGTRAGVKNNSDGIIAIGYYAGNANTSGYDNIYIGKESGKANSSGDSNLFMGIQSGFQNTTGSNNVYVGRFAGSINNGFGNIAMGAGALQLGANSNKNICIGQSAGNNTNADDNIFIGSLSGQKNILGINNIALGSNASYANVNSNGNINIGSYAGQNSILGDNNTKIGPYAGQNSNCNSMIAIGTNAGLNATTDGSIFIGSNAGILTTTGNNNIFFGDNSGIHNVDGYGNLFIGKNTGYTNDEGYYNTFIGYECGYYNTLGFGNIFLGYLAGCNNVSGYNNTFIGTLSGNKNKYGFENIFFGIGAGEHINGGNYPAIYGDITGSRNICIGSFAGAGDIASGLPINCQENVYLGVYAGARSISASKNVCLGAFAGFFMSNGSNNILLGFEAGKNNNNGNNNVCIGNSSGTYIYSGENNVCIGYGSGFTISAFTGVNKNNNYIGKLAGQRNSGDNNIFMGYETIDTTPGGAYTSTFWNNKFAIYQTQTYNLSHSTDANCKILIGGDLTTGTVGIGTIIPDAYVGLVIPYTNTALVVLGKVLANAYTPFTGAHKIILDDTINVNELQLGMLMSANGNAILHDINNSVVSVCISAKNNDKTVFGVYSGSEDTTTTTYTPTPTPIYPVDINSNITIVTSNTTITTYYANSLGEGGILVSNYAGDVQNGDYITSCIIPGYGALQSDDILHSYTVAKCTQNIDWSIIPENVLCPSDGIMYKSLLAACTYHCG